MWAFSKPWRGFKLVDVPNAAAAAAATTQSRQSEYITDIFPFERELFCVYSVLIYSMNFFFFSFEKNKARYPSLAGKVAKEKISVVVRYLSTLSVLPKAPF
jgi:hypothetical protein